MRLRTFVLLVLVLLVGAILLALVTLGALAGAGPLAGLANRGGQSDAPVVESDRPAGENNQQPQAPSPTATPVSRLVSVVVAEIPIPAGERLTADLLSIQSRPEANVAVQAGYTFDSIEALEGRIVKADIAPGKEILSAMLALNPTELVSSGSDLSLYVDRGRISVAFPIDRYSGAAYAFRPGDFVDVLMTMDMVALDEEFRTRLPNYYQRVDQQLLEESIPFLLSPELSGRLELIPLINAVGLVAPSTVYDPIQQPRRVTQLSLQQVEVLWVGNWLDPLQAFSQAYYSGVGDPPPLPELYDPRTGALVQRTPERLDVEPDIVILSLTLQDALVLKFAQESGVRLNLALRAQGDRSNFVTTSISLPQLVQEGFITIPPGSRWGLEPRLEEVAPQR